MRSKISLVVSHLFLPLICRRFHRHGIHALLSRALTLALTRLSYTLMTYAK